MSFKSHWNKEISKSAEPRVFEMIRNADESGTSGTGRVLAGIIFPSGQTVVCWDPVNPTGGDVVNSISVFDSYEAFCKIHIDQHPTNRTEIHFLNDND